MATTEICGTIVSPLNSGSDCNKVFKIPSMIIAVPRKNFSFQLADVADPAAWLNTLIHANIGSRGYPLFGYNARMSDIKNDAGTSIVEKLANGIDVFVKYGVMGMMFETTEGGECYTSILQSFVGKTADFSWILIDEFGTVRCKKNANGSYSGIPSASIIVENPILSDLKAVYKSAITLKFTNDNWVKNGILLTDWSVCLPAIGLINADLNVGTSGISSTTKLKFQVATECGNTDLVAAFPSTIALPANYVVTKVSDGSSVAISAGAVVSGHVELTGTFTSGNAYLVTPVQPSVLLTNGIIGYEIVKTLSISIP